jgi:hypothetical protein
MLCCHGTVKTWVSVFFVPSANRSAAIPAPQPKSRISACARSRCRETQATTFLYSTLNLGAKALPVMVSMDHVIQAVSVVCHRSGKYRLICTSGFHSCKRRPVYRLRLRRSLCKRLITCLRTSGVRVPRSLRRD